VSTALVLPSSSIGALFAPSALFARMATRLSWLSKYSLFFSLPFPHHSPQHRFVSADTHNLDQTDFFSDLELFTSVMEGVSVAREEPRCRQSQAGFDCAVELLARLTISTTTQHFSASISNAHIDTADINHRGESPTWISPASTWPRTDAAGA
jgi:hypothetical protein